MNIKEEWIKLGRMDGHKFMIYLFDTSDGCHYYIHCQTDEALVKQLNNCIKDLTVILIEVVCL